MRNTMLKNTVVTYIGKDVDRLFLQSGTVLKKETFKMKNRDERSARFLVRWMGVPGEEDRWCYEGDVILSVDLTEEKRAELLLKQAAWKEQERAWRLERRTEALATYIDARRVVVPAFVENPDGFRWRPESREWGMARPDGSVNTLVYLSAKDGTAWDPTPTVDINWSAIGAVSPEVAEQMALCLLAVVKEARRIRAEKEAVLGIDV